MDARPHLDELLYSRQIYTMGQEAVKQLGQANVLLFGFQGLGEEVGQFYFSALTIPNLLCSEKSSLTGCSSVNNC